MRFSSSCACVIWAVAFLIAASSCFTCNCSSGISRVARTWFFLHARSIVDVEFLHIAGFLGVHVDLLERNQLGRDRQCAAQGFSLHLDDADRDSPDGDCIPRTLACTLSGPSARTPGRPPRARSAQDMSMRASLGVIGCLQRRCHGRSQFWAHALHAAPTTPAARNARNGRTRSVRVPPRDILGRLFGYLGGNRNWNDDDPVTIAMQQVAR